MRFILACFIAPALFASTTAEKNVILFVWDGLRPDSVTPADTPNLYHLAHEGVWFDDQHSSYPTFTMMNASTFATGDLAGKTGFYGNTLWNNKAIGKNTSGKEVDFQQPVFTEDHAILANLNNAEPLTDVYTLFAQAHKKGLQTATVGKAGPAYFQDYYQQGIIFDEHFVYPRSFAEKLQREHYPLPAMIVNDYSGFKLAPDNGNPTKSLPLITLADGATTNPAKAHISPYNKSNRYLMKSYLEKIVPQFHPTLSVVWLRNPDTTEHNYGVGSLAYYSALREQDRLLGGMLRTLKAKHLLEKTDIIVVSDHAHSTSAASVKDFPLRAIQHGEVAHIDSHDGFSVSGDIRPADLLVRAGFTAYDGLGCTYDPVLTGVRKDGQPVYPVKIDSKGDVCGKENIGMKYTFPAYIAPKILPKNAIIVAPNGGSTYFYVPSHDAALIKKLVRYCQSREEFGAIFVDMRYGTLPGSLPLKTVKLQNNHDRNPDVIVSHSYDAHARVLGFPGTEFNSSNNTRGMHGSFSPIDVHNTLIAFGPDFKKHYVDHLPTANVDVAPTIAYLLGLEMKNVDGRVLLEALMSDKNQSTEHELRFLSITSQEPAQDITLHFAVSPDGQVVDPDVHYFETVLYLKKLKQGDIWYTYFDAAEGVRY